MSKKTSITITDKNIGNQIRILRRSKLKISQEKLAELINVDPKTISRIENSVNIPSLTLLNKITQLLNLEIQIISK